MLKHKHVTRGGEIESMDCKLLAEKVGISAKQVQTIVESLLSKKEQVERLINASFLSEKLKRNYL